MDVLVTGASGFIGREVVRQLREDGRVRRIIRVVRTYDNHPLLEGVQAEPGPRVEDTPCDLSREEEVERLFRRWRPEVVIHLAGKSTLDAGRDSLIRDNILATANLLEHMPEARFVLASSAAVYGWNAQEATEKTKKEPVSTYGWSKLAQEDLLLTYSRLRGIKPMILRLVANVGPGATHGLLRDIVRKLRSSEPTLQLLGEEPGSVKPFLHVSDSARALIFFGLGEETGAYNISPRTTLGVIDVTHIAMDVLKIHKPIEWLGWEKNYRGDVTRLSVDMSRAEKLFSLKYKTSEEAVEAAI